MNFSFLMCSCLCSVQEELKKAGFHTEHYYAIHPLLVFKRYCSGLYNVAVSYVRVDTSVDVRNGEAVSMNIEMMV